jgi:HEAT repeat protein
MPIRFQAGARAGILALVLAATASPSTAQTPFDPIIADLRSPKEGTRIKALRTLTQSGYPQVLSAMAPSVLDSSNVVQLEAIDALLTVCLAPAPDPRKAVVFKAVNGSIAPGVFEGLPLSVLPRAVPADTLVNLSAATRDDDPRVRTAAALALGTLGSAALGVRPADVEQGLVTDVVYALRHPDPATREALLRATGRLFEPPPHASAPVAIGDAVIAAMNDPDTRVRLWASDTLGWLRERRAAPALGERLAFYAKGEEAEAALHALARIAPQAAAPTFREFLTSSSAVMRVMALEGLGRLGDASAVPAITAAMATEKQPSVLLAGAFAFFRLGGEANLDRLVAALVDPALSRQSRAYLTELGPEAAPGLRAYLQRPDPAWRQAAAEVLGASGDPGSLRALEAAARDADSAVAEAVRQALLRLRALPVGVKAH